MHYVKQFHINGVDTKQVACIELHGKPNAATEGYVGVLGIDMDSPTHDVYKCSAVNGSIYTWELLSSGLSMIVSDLAGSGAETVEFPYDRLKTPSLYVVKIGDTILDGEGYVYQVASIGASSCVATYCGIHIVKFGMSAYGLALEQGFEGTLEEWLESLEASVYVRYSAYADGTDYTVEWSRGQRYIGVYCGQTLPTQKTDFVWSRFDAGVYIGSGEMPEWCDLQIDPDGEVTEVVQEPGQSTMDVMSQKAVSNTFANALKGNASGEMVRIDDASPITHKMSVRVSGVDDVGSVKLQRWGKNLFNNDTSKIAEVEYIGESGAVGTRFGYTLRLPVGTYTARAKAIDESTKTGYIYGIINTKGGVFKKSIILVADAHRPKITINVDEGDVLYVYNGVNSPAASAQRLFEKFNIQIEQGTTATDYVPYVEPTEYAVNEDGTVDGVTAIYPTTTLMTDTIGAIIDVTYNRDANKVVADIVSRIAVLESAVLN